MMGAPLFGYGGGLAFALALFCLPVKAATIAVDCGSATDSNFTGGTPFVIAVTPPGTVLDATLRFGSAFTYSFPADNIPYIVTLRFVEPCGDGAGCSSSITGPGQRIFAVTINDQVVLPAVDVFALAGGPLVSVSRSLIVVSADHSLRITFTASMRTAVVSSIEIMPLFDSILSQSTIAARGVLDSKCTRCHGGDGPWLDSAGVSHPFPSDSGLHFDQNADVRKEVGNLDLRTRAAILQGGSRGPAIVPKNGAASLMYIYAAFQPAVPPTLADIARLNAADSRGLLQMPPYAYGLSADPIGDMIERFASLSPTVELSPRQLAALKFWIDLGAP